MDAGDGITVTVKDKRRCVRCYRWTMHAHTFTLWGRKRNRERERKRDKKERENEEAPVSDRWLN